MVVMFVLNAHQDYQQGEPPVISHAIVRHTYITHRVVICHIQGRPTRCAQHGTRTNCVDLVMLVTCGAPEISQYLLYGSGGVSC